MSYIKTLKNGEIHSKKGKSSKLTPYDRFVAKSRNPRINNTEKLIFSAPKTLMEAEKIVDEVLLKRGVIFHLDNVDIVLRQRILDFLLGSNYVMKSELKVIGCGKYLITPKGMQISSYPLLKESK